MPDIIDDKQASGTQRIVGRDEQFAADVFQGDDLINRLQVEAKTSPIPLGKGFYLNVLNSGSPSLNVDGSSTTQVFELPLNTEDRVISRLCFYGRDNGIEFGQFLANWNMLQNGILVEIKSEDNIFTFQPIKTTDDFRNKFSFDPSNFELDKISGDDAFLATFTPRAPFYIRGSGEYSSPDYVKVYIRDDLHRVNYLEFLVEGAIQ